MVVLLSGGVLLIGFGGKSKVFAARVGSPHAMPSTKSDVALDPGWAHRLDHQGNRPGGLSFLPPYFRNIGAIRRPAGSGNWLLLGPPGGDVFDAAASTVDSDIALAGFAPGGSFGGTLYRSSDGGTTWSELPALDGISVFDIESRQTARPTSGPKTASGKAPTPA